MGERVNAKRFWNRCLFYYVVIVAHAVPHCYAIEIFDKWLSSKFAVNGSG